MWSRTVPFFLLHLDHRGRAGLPLPVRGCVPFMREVVRVAGRFEEFVDGQPFSLRGSNIVKPG